MTRVASNLRSCGCLLGLLLASGVAIAQAGKSGSGAAAFDRFADRLEQDELPVVSQKNALSLLGELQGLQPPGDARRALRYRYLNCIFGMNDDPSEGRAYAEQGLADAQRIGDAEAEVNFHFCRGENQESLTTPRDALPDYNAGITIARHSGNLRLVADGLTWRGAVQSLLGEHALALVDFLEAQKFYESDGDPAESEQNLLNIAIAYRRMAEHAKARSYLDKLLALAVRREDSVQQMDAHMQLGFLDLQRDVRDLAGARQHFETAVRLATALEERAAKGAAHLGLAQVWNRQADYHGALAQIGIARREFAAIGNHSDDDMLALQTAEAHEGLDEREQSFRDYATAQALLRKSGNLRYLAELLEHRSHSYEALGRFPEALADLHHLLQVQAELDRKAKSYNAILMGYQFDVAQREQENRSLEADRKLRDEQLASLQRVRHWQRLALALGGVLIVLLLWQAMRQVRRARRLHRLAMTDALTGVANRRRMEQVGELAIDHARSSGEPLALVVLDIDHFKRVNDSHGHAAGDQVLLRLARVCQKALRKIDYIGRIGGEEFVVILPGSGMEAASRVAERLRRDVATLDLDDVVPGLRISVSLGAAQFRTGENLAQLMVRADQALYLAKRQGRDRVVVVDHPSEIALTV